MISPTHGRPFSRLWRSKTTSWSLSCGSVGSPTSRQLKDLHDRARAYLTESPNDREVLLLFARSCNGVADWPGAARRGARCARIVPNGQKRGFSTGAPDCG